MGASPLSAAPLAYTETFIGDTFQDTSGSVIEFGNGSATITAGLWSGGQNAVTLDGTGTGTLAFTVNVNSRSAAAYIDLNGVDSGTYTISFDLSAFNFATTSTNATASASVWKVGGVTAGAGGGVSFDLGTGAGSGFSGITPTGAGSTAAQLGSNILFSGTGITSAPFTLASAGVAGDYLAIVMTRDGGSLAGTGLSTGGYTVDTITIVPEPSTLALLGLGIVGYLVRRRR